MSENNYLSVDGHSCGTSKLKTYTAHKNNVVARLEEHDCVAMFIKVTNRTQDYVLKCDQSELIVLREILNLWHKDQEVKR